MPLNFGTGVTRTLDPVARQFSSMVFQAGKPPLDSELNLMTQTGWESLRQAVQSLMPSGFFLDPTRALNDYQFIPAGANLFKLGNPRVPVGVWETAETQPTIWANVNGWVIPVAGTDNTTIGDLTNLIKLYPPPQSNGRVDFVFLEAWQTRIDANPSTVNKPSASTIWKYGNVKFGGTNITDDLEDPTVGFDTTARIQVQYRIRVYGSGGGMGGGAALDVYPDGLGDPNILGQATWTSPVGGFPFVNMREQLGDPSLWRAGDGDYNNDLGTVDGYTYAIPICAVFRRSSSVYEAVNPAGTGTQNGAFLRTPGNAFLVNPLTGARVLTTASLTAALSSTAGVTVDATINITNLNGSGLEDSHHVLAGTFLVIDQEIVGISSVNIPGGTITIPAGGRGRWGTAAVGHAAGTVLNYFNSRPDGLYADQIAETDILDLRRGVNAADWDYSRLLEHNVASLMRGNLRTAWKLSATGDTQGVLVHEVDYLYADGSIAVPTGTEALDGPDGIRQIWSDAAAIQPDVTMLLANDAPQDANDEVGFTNDTFDVPVSWDVAPDFHPSGFMNVAGAAAPLKETWRNGTSLFFFLGGASGSDGARGTFRDGTTRAVRAVMPYEYWKAPNPDCNQAPWTLRFLGQMALEPYLFNIGSIPTHPLYTYYPGPMYPYRETNFEKPFLVLGGLLWSAGKTVIPATDLSNTQYEIEVGINFDTDGVFIQTTGGVLNVDTSLDPTQVSVPLLQGTRTLYDMLTDGGKDRTGASSEIYVVLYGDTGARQNNGAFRVVGVGTKGCTNTSASSATQIMVTPIGPEGALFDDATGNLVTVEFRSQHHNSEDTSSYATKVADLVVVLTDIGGVDTDHPWNQNLLGFGEPNDLSMPFNVDGFAAIPNKAVVSMTLQYHPGRGGTARVADEIVRFSMRGSRAINPYLRQSPVVLDSTFPAATGMPPDETFWDPVHVQLWNKLPSKGRYPQKADNYGGNVVGASEQDREHELFIDRGSKTLIFRPFRDQAMTLQGQSVVVDATWDVNNCLWFYYVWPDLTAIDCIEIFTGGAASGKKYGFPIPREYMPRFGRQDIPYYTDVDNGTGPFLPGINHLFRDSTVLGDPVFNIIGGYSNLGTPGVNIGYFATGMSGVPIPYGHSSAIAPGGTTPAIGARKTTDISPFTTYGPEVIAKLAAVNSSDFGNGLRGIQLPPGYGIARLYGVYEAADYLATGGKTFKANRYEVEVGAAPNLLREDATQQTLFILQDGAKDYTVAGVLGGDHTYIVPENVLDLSRIDPAHQTPTNDFADYHYVVVCTFFGFANGWINNNNMVLMQKYDGNGSLNTDGDNPQLENLHMIIPSAAALNDQFYAAYNRTVYQGDVYGSRGGDIKTSADYETRYGQLSTGAQYSLRTPIQQYDASGNYVPETPNARAFEVLASLDFYTTLGTGKVGGLLYPGTMLDVGYTQDTLEASKRYPETGTSKPWTILSRAFSEGQKENSNRAALSLTVLDTVSLNPQAGEWSSISIGLAENLSDSLTIYGSTPANKAFLTGPPLNIPLEDIFEVDPGTKIQSLEFTHTGAGTVVAGAHSVITKTVAGATVGDNVVLNYPLSTDPLEYRAYVTASDTVTIWITNQWPLVPVKLRGTTGATETSIYRFSAAIPVVAAHSRATLAGTVSVTGADPAKNQVVVVRATDITDVRDLLFTGYVSALNTVSIVAYNYTVAPIGGAFNMDLEVTLLEEDLASNHTYTSLQPIYGRVLHSVNDSTQTARNLAVCINANSHLQQTIKAESVGSDQVIVTAVPTGQQGNDLWVSIAQFLPPLGPITQMATIQSALRLEVPYPNTRLLGAYVTRANLFGGQDYPFNAGNGTSQINLTGMTERLPLGALLQDSDFLCENPLGDTTSACKTSPAGPRPSQTMLPLTVGGEEYDRFFGEPGELLGMSDGAVSVTHFTAYTTATPAGTRIYRMFRGGGPVFVLSGDHPGAPIEWTADTLQLSNQPVLKGGLLACRALLVRNFYEEINPMVGSYPVTNGDEIQMVILTNGILGDGRTQEEGLEVNGIVSPAGYGEGYAAADRYRLSGRPMFRGFSRQVANPANVTLAIYPDTLRS